jgi:aromatase
MVPVERTREVRCWWIRTIRDGFRWMSTHHLVGIPRPVPQVFAIADDLPRWPEIFPPCQSVEILERRGNTTRFRITAYANEKLVSWVSQRIADKEGGRVDFAQLEPFPPLAIMKGTWWFKEVPGGTLIHFVHHFMLDNTYLATLHNGAVREEELAMYRAVDANSVAELQALRNACEQFC